MKLNEAHIEQLFAFTKKHLVETYDVQVELVDHLANAIEVQWTVYPDRTFEEALQVEYKKFGVFGFSSLVEEKAAALQSHYWKLIRKEMIQFFSIPKILLTVLIFSVCFQFLKNPTEITEILWFVTLGLGTLSAFYVMIIQSLKMRKRKQKYLLHGILYHFYSLPLMSIYIFNFSINTPWSLFKILTVCSIFTLFVVLLIILYTRIIPLIQQEIEETDKKFQKVQLI